jgi:hypothetical protein
MLTAVIFVIAAGDPLRSAPSPVFGLEERWPISQVEIDVYRVLKVPVTLHFQEVSLDSWTVDIREDLGIPVHLEVRALKEAGIKRDLPISADVDELPLELALEVVLGQYELTFGIRRSGLWITTEEEAATFLVTRVYDVTSIVGRGRLADFDSLIDVITAVLSPTAWEGSGPGPIHPLYVGNRSLIVVNQTHLVHAEISHLLRTLSGQFRGPMEEIADRAPPLKRRLARRTAPAAPRLFFPGSVGAVGPFPRTPP